MSGKKLTALVLLIIFFVVLFFYLNRPEKITIKSCVDGMTLYSQLPPPFSSPKSSPVVIDQFVEVPFYGMAMGRDKNSPHQMSKGHEEFLKIFFSQRPGYFGVYWVRASEIIRKQ